MSLRIPVFISSVNNLSDARYCAGMGVKWMGFSHSDIDKSYSLSDLKGMMEWIEGVSTILEVDSLENVDTDLISSFDGVMLKKPFSDKANEKLILELDIEEIRSANELLENMNENNLVLISSKESAKLSSENKSLLQKLLANHSLILGFDINLSTIEWIEKELKPAGIMLKGGNEIRPGFKTFDDLADILEYLEVD